MSNNDFCAPRQKKRKTENSGITAQSPVPSKKRKVTTTASKTPVDKSIILEQKFKERYHIIDPRDRFNCQQKLYSTISNLNGRDLTESWQTGYHTPAIFYCRQVEQNIYKQFYNDFTMYKNKVKQIIFNLHSNGKLLTQKYGPNVLTVLDDYLLSEETLAATKRLDYEQKMQACSSILANRDIFSDDTDSFKALMKCRLCKGDQITWIPKQTRSSDEGNTIFCTCNNPKCGAKWKI